MTTMKRTILPWIAGSLLVLGQAVAQPGSGPVPVRAAEARIQTMSSTLLVPGTVVSRNDARLAAEVEEIPMAQSVDLVLYDSLDNPALRRHIRTQGIEWYRRDDRLEEPGERNHANN